MDERLLLPLKDDEKSTSYKLQTVTIVNIVITLTSTVTFYKELHALDSFPRFSNTLNTAFATVLPCILLTLFYFKYQYKPPSNVPISHLLFLALFNSSQNVLQNAGIDGIDSGAYCVLLNQIVVPLTMVLSFTLFRTNYTCFQILGAMTVVAGVIISNASSSHPRSVKYTLIFLAGCVPQTALNLLIEQTYTSPKNLILDVTWLLMIMNLISLPLNVIFDFISDGFETSTTWNDHEDGFQCLFHRSGGSFEDDSVDCNSAYIYAILYAPLGVMFCISNFVLVRSVSSTYYFVVVAFILPVQNLLLSWNWLMGSASNGDISNISNLCGMVVVTLGLFLYVRGMSTVGWDKVADDDNDDDGDRKENEEEG